MVKAAAEPVEGRWALPEGWSWHRAKDIAKIVGGSTPKNAADTTNYSEDGTPWLTPADLSGYSKPTISQGRRNLAPHVVNRSALLPAGAVLISSRAPVGYCAVASNCMVTNQGFRSLILADHIDPFFVRYYVLFSRKYLEDHASGTTFKELSGGALGDLVFPVPPLGVQHQIVARIDEQFAEIDDGEAALTRARADLTTWRKALLKAAVTGELTADWRAANPPMETGADFLSRVLTERRVRWESEQRNRGKRYVEPAAPDITTLPTLPDGWIWTSIAQLAIVDSGGTPPGIEAASAPAGDVPWFKVSSMSLPGNETMLGLSRWWLSREQAQSSNLRIFPAGSLVFPKLGGALLTNKRRVLAVDACLDLNNMAVSPMKGIGDYISALFSVIDLADLSDGSIVPQLKRQAVESIVVALPPASELAEVVRRLQVAFGTAGELHSDASDMKEMSATLRQSILAAAFRGELA